MKRKRKVLFASLLFALFLASLPQQEMLASETKNENIVIVLDPGHDDTHAGAQNGNLGEEDIVFKIVQYCKEELEKYGGITVYTTRDTYACANGGRSVNVIDCNIKRVQYAASVDADVFVSFHLNANRNKGTSGVGVYYPNSNYRPDLGQAGKGLAELLLKNLKNLGIKQWSEGVMIRNSEDNTRYPDGSLADYLGVIRESKQNGIMAVLIEHAFLSNASDVANFLNTDEKLKALGVADAKAIVEYYDLKYGVEYAYGDAEISISRENEEAAFTVCADGIKNAYNVRFAVWSEDGGEDDLVWYSGKKQENGIWSADVFREYHNSTGVYNVDTYIYRYDGSRYIVDSMTKTLSAEGIAESSWKQIDGIWYYIDENGVLETGWKKAGNVWYYLGKDGAMATGWVNVGGTWYYMHENGAMATGWVNDEGVWYYMGENGAMTTGWKKIGDTWYYMDGSGAMATDWANDRGTWYYMDESGAMLTGWVNDEGIWYYMCENGAMLIGWLNDNGTWYYMDGSGAMATGWVNDRGTWYYMNDNGAMETNTWIGNDYVNESGAWISR